MKICFVSNFLNHHQKPLCDCMVSILGKGNFCFIATTPQAKEQGSLGYVDYNSEFYCLRMYESEESHSKAKRIIKNADVVIIGGVSNRFVLKRLYTGKPVIRYGERILKRGDENRNLKFLVNVFVYYILPISKVKCLLAASAYAPSDYEKCHMKVGEYLKWGYFPECKTYDIQKLIEKKESNEIVWCGRFIDWKHPEVVVELAKRLESEHINYHVTMIGDGALLDPIKEQSRGLNISFTGSVPSTAVRSYLEKATVLISTSDYNEGWGAVINEGMNSGCAVVASRAIGSVPSLIDHKRNGFSYQNDNTSEAYSYVKTLLMDNELAMTIGKAAYETIANTWNAEIAAKRLCNYIKELLSSNRVLLPKDGPCSRAEFISNN